MKFIHFRLATLPSGTTGRSTFGTGLGANDALCRVVNVSQWRGRVVTAPGAGKSYTMQFNIAGTPTGPALTIAGTATLASNTAVGVSLPLGNAAANESGFTVSTVGGPASQRVHWSYGYECRIPDDDVCVQGASDGASNITLAATNRFFGFHSLGTTASSTTESVTQAPWPVAGTFKFIGIHYGVAVGTTVALALRKNAVDAVVLSLPGAAASVDLIHTSEEVTVAAGDLISFRYNRTAGTDVTFNVGVMIGFQ